MSRALRGALAGFGQVAENAHAPAFRASKDFLIAAVADENPQRLKAAQAAFPKARAYASLEALLGAEDDLDFVDIATPPFLHGRQAAAALKAGLHVLCEKPLTLNPEELSALRQAAAEAGRAVFTVHNWAYAPQWIKAFELISSGVLGVLRHVELHALRTQPACGAVPGDWRRRKELACGGILVDHGWHALYLLHRLLGGRALKLTASLNLPDDGGAEDEATVFFQFKAAAALIYLTWRAPVRGNWARLHGDHGLLELRDDHWLLQTSGRPVERFDFPQKLSAGSSHPDWFAAMLPDFAAAVTNPALRGNLEEAAFCARVIEQIYKPARTAAAA